MSVPSNPAFAGPKWTGSTVLRIGMGVMPVSLPPQPTVMRATSSMQSGWRRVQQGGWVSVCGAALSMAWASSSARWRRAAVQVSRVLRGGVLGDVYNPISVGHRGAVVRDGRKGP